MTTTAQMLAGARCHVVAICGSSGQVSSVGDGTANVYEFLGRSVHSTHGGVVELWSALVENTIASGATITATFNGNVQDKCIASWEYTVAASTKLALGPAIQAVEVAAGASGLGSVAHSGLASASRLYLRASFKNAASTATITASTNFTSWGLAIRPRNNAATVVLRAEHRINTSTGETSNPTFAVNGAADTVFAALVEQASSQAVTGGTIAATQLFAPTVVPGDVAVTTGTITAATQLFAPTVVPGDVAVTGGTIAAATQLFAPTVAQPGADPVLIAAQFVVGGTRPDVFTSVPFVAGRTYFLAMMIDKAGGQTDWSVETVQFLHGATDRTSSWVYRSHTHVASTRSLGIFQYDCATTETVNFSYQGNANGNVRFGALIECPGTATIVQSAVIGPVAAALSSGDCTLGSTITGSNVSLAFVGTRNANADQSVIPRTGWTELSDTPTGEGSAGASGTLETQFDSPGEQSASATAASGTRTWGVIHIEISIAGAGAQAVTGGTISSGNQLFAPSTSYAVTTGSVASAATLFAPTVAPGAVAITTGTISATQLSAPSLAYAVTTGTRSSAVTLFAPTLAYALTTGTIAAATALFAPTVVSVQLVTGGTISGTQLFAPTLAYVITTGHITQTVVSAPTLAYVVQLPVISGTSLSPPSIAVGPVAVTTGTVASGHQLFAPTVHYVVTTGTISATAVFAPTLAYVVTAGFRSSAVQLFAPTLAYAVTTGTRASAVQLFAPTIANTQLVTTGTISATALFSPTVTAAGALAGGHVFTTQIFAPSVATLTFVTTGTIATGHALFAPTLVYAITTGTRASAVVLFAPAVFAEQAVTVGTIAATVLYAPSIATLTYVTTGTIQATVLFEPSVATGPVDVTTGYISPTTVLFPPIVIGGLVVIINRRNTIEIFPSAIAVEIFRSAVDVEVFGSVIDSEILLDSLGVEIL